MTQATVIRKSPCRQCGGRYFIRTVHVVPAVLATAVALGGFAKAVVGSGVLDIDLSNPASGLALSPSSFPWAVFGILGAAVVAWLGGGYRCISCDTRR